jgi:phenylpropionate dioxygenase-like ring-hydroxylating dioxygenase large terminal subunit
MPDTTSGAREQLVRVARDLFAHAGAGTMPVADDVLELSASVYTDAALFDREVRGVFRRVPVLLAASCELAGPGSRKALEVAGVPVVLVRGRDGVARAFLNVCTHRGSIIVDGCGSAARLVCPYHGWTFDDRGALVGVPLRSDVGDVDGRSLRQFRVLEKAGLVWAVLDPDSTLDIDGFLGVFGAMLERFAFDSWQVLGRRTLDGANWKLAFDAHLEFYHLPVLHRATFGSDVSPRAYYYNWGPHQRLTRPAKRGGPAVPEYADLFAQQHLGEEHWTDEAMLLGEWIVYPNVSINSFYTGVRGVLISQIFPGATVDQSTTVQTYLVEHQPDDEARAAALKLFDFLGQVVDGEDLPTSFAQQRALGSGLLPSVCYGRNEGGVQRFHRWTERILDTHDSGLNTLFRAALD